MKELKEAAANRVQRRGMNCRVCGEFTYNTGVVEWQYEMGNLRNLINEMREENDRYEAELEQRFGG